MCSAADFPNRHVVFLPDGTDVVGYFADGNPLVVGDRLAKLVVEVYSIHQFSIDVELFVRGGAIADANGFAASIAVKVVELNFGEVGFATNAFGDR